MELFQVKGKNRNDAVKQFGHKLLEVYRRSNPHNELHMKLGWKLADVTLRDIWTDDDDAFDISL